jgi:RNA polymerase sigma-70 factor (ECF subfamily)
VGPDQLDAARLRRGDTGGLAGLVERHQERLFRYLLRLLGDQAMAEDVFQQAWLHVAERIARYDAARPFAPWLLALARNLALDQLRRARPASLEEVDEPRAAADVDPHAWAVAGERRARLLAELTALSALDREVLALRFEAGLELAELAEALGVPLPTAKARLYRALARLRERLLARASGEAWL